MKEETKRWIEKAKRDFDTAGYLFQGKRYEDSSLFCQQATEKALKALILEKTNELIKIHDLVELGKKADIEEELLKSLEKLSYVYLDSRYPDTTRNEYTEEETKSDLKIAEESLKWVEKNL